MSLGEYVFKFINNPSYSSMKFLDVFKSITLRIPEE